MKRKIKRILSIILVSSIAGIVLISCASPRAIRKEFESYTINPNGNNSVYIATEDTPWKQEVVSQLAEKLGSEYRLQVENLQTLLIINPNDWDVVLVFSTFYAFGLQSDTAAYLENLTDKENTILLATSAISDLAGYGVDSITAASVGNTKADAKALTPKREPADVAAEIAEVIETKIER